MNKSIILTLVIITLLLVACSKVDKTVSDNENIKPQQTLETPNTESEANQYVNSQFVDLNETVEIGEMI